HQLWVVKDQATVAAITRLVDALPALYIADGHHRSAAASRVADARGHSERAHDYFLAVIVPHHEMTILDYNRVVRDLNGHRADTLLAVLRKSFVVETSAGPVRPASSPEFGMYLGKQWYKLTIKRELIPQRDPIGRLPITLLSKNVIEPLLGIADQRKDKRIDF